jgi:hypothetical protein
MNFLGILKQYGPVIAGTVGAVYALRQVGFSTNAGNSTGY